MENLLLTIDISDKSFLYENLEKAKSLKKEVDEKWNLVDTLDENESFDLVYELEEKEKTFSSYLSIYSLSSVFDKHIGRSDKMAYDVTKIWISEKTYDELKSLDKEILDIFYKERYSEQYLAKQLSMLYLFSGFSIKAGLDDNIIYIQKDVLKEQRID